MQQNICKFIPKTKAEIQINILNFVYETTKQSFDTIRCDACYKMYFVTSGKGRVRIAETVYELEENDVFFTFPSTRYSIESFEGFSYMYISYLGTRSNQIMENYGITKKNFVFQKVSDLDMIWKSSIEGDTSVLALRCEGILLYTFSKITQPTTKKSSQKHEIVSEIQKYIDENFTDPTLSLIKISNKCSYNPKYISAIFKRKIGTGISQYLSTLRIQYACTLIEQGVTSVKDIAFLCGYRESLYFSKVFKVQMGISPKEYIHAKPWK